ncbi:MAG: hypothetical protein GF308_03025 [Candidatus Heimdallarchaeota archaeon]|nr:hypothetical protein [Candidatus Heimdallarchaeota archaeon]
MLKKTHPLFLILILIVSNFNLVNDNFVLGSSDSRNSNTKNPSSYLQSRSLEDLELEVTAQEQKPVTPILFSKGHSGPQRYAVICVKFYDIPIPRWSIPEIEEIMSIENDLWQNISNHKISIDYQVVGWYTLDPDMNSTNFGVDYGTWDLFHAAVALGDPTIDYSQFGYVLVWIGNFFYRGLSSLGVRVELETNEGDFDVAGCTVGENPGESYYTVIGRTAHEIGHTLGLQHTHYGYRSDYSLMAWGFPSDLNIYSQLIAGVTDWFDDVNNQEVISTGDGGYYMVRPRYYDIPSGDIQSLKVEVSDSKYFMVEVVKQWGEDKWCSDEGVYIYFVDKEQKNYRECMDIDATPATSTFPDDQWDVLWQVGQSYHNATYDITIEVIDSSPAGFEVYVSNSADFVSDLMIKEWGDPPGHTPPYESYDIWVDSPANMYDYYRHNIGGVPIGIGDDPWANHENRLYARIHNIGDLDAKDVVVRFYERNPIAAGVTNPWEFINETQVDVDAGDKEEVYVLWKPEVASGSGDSGLMKVHGCVKVVIEQNNFEIDIANNQAQENIDFFEIIPGTWVGHSKEYIAKAANTIIGNFQVGNPFSRPEDIYINLVDETPGWEISGGAIGKFTAFEAEEIKSFSIEITPGPEVEFGDEFEAHLVTGYIHYDIPFGNESLVEGHLVPFGGISFEGALVHPTVVDITPSYDNGVVTVEGELTVDAAITLFPDGGHKYILLEYAYETDRTPSYGSTEMDADGRFTFNFDVTKQGNYSVRAYYAGSPILQASASPTLMIDTVAGTVWTSSSPTALFPGFSYYLAVGTIVTITMTVILKKKKRMR